MKMNEQIKLHRREVFLRMSMVILMICLSIGVFSQLRLPEVIGDGMVLQQNTTVDIWGWADAKTNVMVRFGWEDQAVEIKSNKNGRWSLKTQTPSADKVRYEIEITAGEESIKLVNVVMGEVWLCSGQSNMEMPLSGNRGQSVSGSTQAIASSANPWLRLFETKKRSSLVALDTLVGSSGWLESAPNSASTFSAVGYFFGSQLQKTLDVPVGLISSSWGGTPIEAWMSVEAHSSAQVIDLEDMDWAQEKRRTPTGLFNGMINPLMPYTIKGALWYQGEGNARNNQEDYLRTLPAMVADWREKFAVNFSFYFVQITPFSYYHRKGLNTAWMRSIMVEAQRKIPNSGIVVTTDLGAEWSIHPPRKKEVGDRLFYLAMNKTYGFESIDCEGPVYERMEVEEGRIIVHFSDKNDGIYSPQREVSGFEIAAEDGVFHKANAKIRGDRMTLEVWSDKVSNPVDVRYAWDNYVEATLFDNSMLPVSSFSTNK